MRIFALFISLLFLFNSGCSENSSLLHDGEDFLPTLTGTENGLFLDEMEYTFYLDGEPVSGKSIDFDQEGIHVLVQGKPSEKFAGTLEMQVFTTDEAYYRYGYETGIPCREFHKMDMALAQFVEENDVENYYQETGVVHPGLLELEGCIRRELQDIGTLQRNTNKKILLASLYTECNANNPHFFAVPTMPTLIRNNQVSRIRRNNVLGWTHLYDKSFFRKKMFTVLNWGFLPGNEINMCNHPVYKQFNDKLSSALFY